MREPLRVAWYRLASTWHHRRRSYLSIVLLIGLVGGIAMGAIAAARRTQSSFSTFLSSVDPSDLSISLFPQNFNASAYSPSVLHTISRLPHVAGADTWIQPLAAPLARNGAPNITSLSDLQVISSLGGEFFHRDRLAVIAGRMVTPSSRTDFVTTRLGAQLFGWHVGQRIPFGFYTPAQVSSPTLGAGTVTPLLRVDARLVGLVVSDTTLVQDQADAIPTFALFSPTLGRYLATHDSAQAAYVALSVSDHTPSAVASVEREFQQVQPSNFLVQTHVASLVAARADRAIKPESIALALFGIIAGLAALVIAGQAVARQLWSQRAEFEVIRALGANPATTVLDGLTGVLGSVVVGALLATAVAVALSPLAPIGPVRPVYPSRGFATDWTVLGTGAATLLVVIGAVAVLLARRIAVRADETVARVRVRRPSVVTGAAAASGLSAPVVVGAGFALEAADQHGNAPIRSALVGTVLAVVVVVTTVIFGSSLQTLVSHPSLYGWNFTYALGSESGPDVPPRAVSALRSDPKVAALSEVSLADPQIDGQTVPAIFEAPGEAVSPPIVSGRSASSSDEIVLGAGTMTTLHTHVGGTVVVSYGTPKAAPLYVAPRTLTVVGTAILPAVGFPSVQGDHTSMGTGAVISKDVVPPAMRAALQYPDPVLNGPEFVFVRMKPGVSSAAGLTDMRRVAGIGNQAFASAPNGDGQGDTVVVLGDQKPAEIVNYHSTGATPLLLAGGLALGAVAALGLTLTTSVRRRRRDLAVLKTIGFTTRQLSTSVAVQATVIAVVGVVLGVPLGIVVGRWTWVLFARQIYAVPQPTVPVLWMSVVVAGALLVINLVAAAPGRAAGRTPTALVLRDE